MDQQCTIPVRVSLSEHKFKASLLGVSDMAAKFDSVTKVSAENYEELYNKPQINGVELSGDKSGADLRLQEQMNTLSQTDIEKILYLG